jgi:hypothetical protein
MLNAGAAGEAARLRRRYGFFHLGRQTERERIPAPQFSFELTSPAYFAGSFHLCHLIYVTGDEKVSLPKRIFVRLLL